MLRALFCDRLLAPTQDPANAQVFVKYKSQEKAALIVNVVNFNHGCAHKARRFCLTKRAASACPHLRDWPILSAMFVQIRGPVNWTSKIAIGPSIYRPVLSTAHGWRLAQTGMQLSESRLASIRRQA